MRCLGQYSILTQHAPKVMVFRRHVGQISMVDFRGRVGRAGYTVSSRSEAASTTVWSPPQNLSRRPVDIGVMKPGVPQNQWPLGGRGYLEWNGITMVSREDWGDWCGLMCYRGEGAAKEQTPQNKPSQHDSLARPSCMSSSSTGRAEWTAKPVTVGS